MSEKNQPLHHITASGKYRNWRKARLQSIALGAAYKRIGGGFQKKAERVFMCSRRIDFAKPQDDQMSPTVVNRYGCKDRLCPGCQSSRSRKNFMELMQLYQRYHEAYPEDRAAMLTLTIPNVSVATMKEELSALLNGFRKLTRRKSFELAVRAWFRALEVSYNPNTGLYHPHIHALLLFPPYYFDKRHDVYLKHEQWLKLWQQVMRRTDIKHLDIRMLKARPETGDGNIQNPSMGKAIAEIAKYATKPADIFMPRGNGFAVDEQVIFALAYTLKHRRLIAYSKVFREYRRDQNPQKTESEMDDLDVYLWLEQPDVQTADYYSHEETAFNQKL
ncbi:MAG: protein rep [Rhizobiales bacterium]|nr:protein rep [Hyphomicrobiales bacterium]